MNKLPLTSPLELRKSFNRALGALRPDPRNPRLHSARQVQQIARSIQSFGFNVPILVDRHGQILAGHGRYLAAKQIGLAEVLVIELDHLSPAQARAFAIADNRIAESSKWDEAMLGEIFLELKAIDLDFQLEETGFETAEIDVFIKGRERHGNAETEIIPEPSGPPVSREGDIWALGRHRVACANSRLAKSYSDLLGELKVDAVFVDPPFNVPIDGHASGKGKTHHREFPMASGEMSSNEFAAFLRDCLSNLASFSKAGSTHFVCMDWRHLPEVLAAGEQVYSALRNLCVWVKDAAAMGSLYRSRHELVLVYVNGSGPQQNNVQLGRFGRSRTNVWEYRSAATLSKGKNAENLLAMHPTVKPTALVADAIQDCTRRGEIVLDAFLGSGSTLLAAERVGRICYGMELDPQYVDLAIQRWQTATGKQATHLASGMNFEELRLQREVKPRKKRVVLDD